MEDAHSAVIGIPDQKENVSWFAGPPTLSASIFLSFVFAKNFLVSRRPLSLPQD